MKGYIIELYDDDEILSKFECDNLDESMILFRVLCKNSKRVFLLDKDERMLMGYNKDNDIDDIVITSIWNNLGIFKFNEDEDYS